jgi:hypothetical protein
LNAMFFKKSGLKYKINIKIFVSQGLTLLILNTLLS